MIKKDANENGKQYSSKEELWEGIKTAAINVYVKKVEKLT